VSPMLRGMFGIEEDAVTHTLKFAPHAPATWPGFAVHNVPVGTASLDLRYRKTTEDVTLEVTQKGEGQNTLDFEPALSLRAKVLGVEVNGRAGAFRVDANEVDQHVVVHVAVREGTTTVRIRVKNDFGVVYETGLPKLGEKSSGLRILGEEWSADRNSLTLEVSGQAGNAYELSVWNGQQVRSVEGASFNDTAGLGSVARVPIPGPAGTGYQTSKVIFHF